MEHLVISLQLLIHSNIFTHCNHFAAWVPQLSTLYCILRKSCPAIWKEGRNLPSADIVAERPSIQGKKEISLSPGYFPPTSPPPFKSGPWSLKKKWHPPLTMTPNSPITGGCHSHHNQLTRRPSSCFYYQEIQCRTWPNPLAPPGLTKLAAH